MIEPKYSKSEPAIFISVGVLRRQLLQQRLRLLQIARVEPFGEPAVDRSEKLASLATLALSLAGRGLVADIIFDDADARSGFMNYLRTAILLAGPSSVLVPDQ